MDPTQKFDQVPPPLIGVAEHLPSSLHSVASDTPPLPPQLERAWVEELLNSLTCEYEPVGPTEHALVWDMARAIAAMQRWGISAEAVARRAATRLPELSFLEDGLDTQDAQFAAIANENCERCERHSLGNSRAFQRALSHLLERQRQRRAREESARAELPALFRDEAACERYLAERLQRKSKACKKCASRDGYYYEDRRIWECARCNAQTGLRTGTVMARSQLSLWHWFTAIGWMLLRPTISANELARKVGLHRATTVRSVMHKIRTAMAAEDASDQLAGLDLQFSTARPHLRQASV